MNKQQLVRAFAIATVAFVGSLLSTIVLAEKPAHVPSTGPVPKAHCGPGDRTESGLQGQTTPQERFTGDSELGYNCNLELVGKYQGEGAYSQDGPTFFGDCAYYGTDNITSLQQHHGVVVVDASDPRHPYASAYLDDSAAMLAPHETLKAHAQRELLVAGQNNGPGFAVYDLSADCRHPVLKASIMLENSFGHQGNFAPDGLTFYLTQMNRGIGGYLYPVDLTDPSNPQMLPPWQFLGDGRSHENWLNPKGFLPGVPAGTRLYAGQPGLFGNTASSIGPDGLVIEDVSDYQFRRPNPQIRIISKLFWDDQGQAEQMLPVKIKGRPYIISTDESGGAGGAGGLRAACARGASAGGYPNVIDVSDETHPKIVAKIMLEVSLPANCSLMLNDPPDAGGAIPNYSAERCTVDSQENATMLACGWVNAGLRVFDIRDPYHPKEIAYWKPPATRTAFLPGSGAWGPGVDRTFDKIAGYMRFHKRSRGHDKGKENHNDHNDRNGNGKDGHELEIWTVSDSNGFQVLRFTDSFKVHHKDLLDDSDDE